MSPEISIHKIIQRRETSYAHGKLSGIACQVPGPFPGLRSAWWYFAEGRQAVEPSFRSFHDTCDGELGTMAGNAMEKRMETMDKRWKMLGF